MTQVSQPPLVDLSAGALVIADLHLDPASVTPGIERFETFVKSRTDAAALWILGDLFDAWVGPAHMELAGARRVIELLRALRTHGTRIEILVGNRDFLLNADFERASGARVHPTGFVAEVGAQRLLCIHGDELCTLDHGYQRLKRVLRSPPVTWTALRLPRSIALAAARRLRRASVQAVASKPSHAKAQQLDEARRLADESRCPTLICGHAHTYRDERHGALRWIVLDAFGGERDLLRLGSDGAIEARSSAQA